MSTGPPPELGAFRYDDHRVWRTAPAQHGSSGGRRGFLRSPGGGARREKERCPSYARIGRLQPANPSVARTSFLFSPRSAARRTQESSAASTASMLSGRGSPDSVIVIAEGP